MVRRRRVVLVLSALTASTLLAALISGATAAWFVLLLVVATGAAYLLLLHHVRRVLAEREFAALLRQGGAEDLGWDGLKLPCAGADLDAAVPVAPGRATQTWALVRFMLANMAGWALSPVVFMTTLLLGKTPQDTTGQRWLANLQAAQERLREQSLRTLAISATTASVTAAGTVAVMAGTGTASAATVPTSAIPTTGAGLPAAVTSTTYRVMAGDTLGSIAARFGTTWSTLAALNHIANPNLIYVGQVLRIDGSGSGGGGPTWGAPAGATYRVVAGDTLGSIAARFGTTWPRWPPQPHRQPQPHLRGAGPAAQRLHGRAGPDRDHRGATGTGPAPRVAPTGSWPATPWAPSPPASAPPGPRWPPSTTSPTPTSSTSERSCGSLAPGEGPRLLRLPLAPTGARPLAGAGTGTGTSAVNGGGGGRPGGAGTGRQAVPVGRGGTEQLRLLGSGHVRLGACRGLASPLQRGSVPGHRPHQPQPASAGRPGVLRHRGGRPAGPCDHLHRQRPDRHC